MPSAQISNLNRKNLSAFFFDFDDVLADSLTIKANAFLSLFEETPVEEQQAIEEHFYRYTGRSRQEKLHYIYEHILQETLSEQRLQSLCNEFQQRTLSAVIAAPEIKGANRLLAAIPDSIPCFIISGTPEIELQQIVAEREMARAFQEIKGTPTPKEENIAHLLETYNLAPEQCLMLGDGMVDKDAADANQMPFAGIVAPGKLSPFPKGTQTFRDLEHIGTHLGLLQIEY